MRTLSIASLLLLACATVSAQPARAPTDPHADRALEVTMLETMPTPCAAIVTDNATLYLSVQRLAGHVAHRPYRIVDEHDAAADLRARRAAGLLERLTGPEDDARCRTMQSGLGDEDGYAILREIEDGEVFARTRHSGARIPVLLVRYQAIRGPACGSGTIDVGLPGRDTKELALSWFTTYAGACPGPGISKPSA